MKTRLTQRKFRAEKKCCQMCKPYKRHRETKWKPSEVRKFSSHQEQMEQA